MSGFDPKRKSGMTALETVAFRVADASASTLSPFGLWVDSSADAAAWLDGASVLHAQREHEPVKSEAHQTVTKKPW